MTIGERIRLRREELNLSQEELAQKLGFKSRSSVNKIELGQRNLNQSKIKLIADALQTTPQYIMGWDESSDSVQQVVETYLKLDQEDRLTIYNKMLTMLQAQKYSAPKEK